MYSTEFKISFYFFVHQVCIGEFDLNSEKDRQKNTQFLVIYTCKLVHTPPSRGIQGMCGKNKAQFKDGKTKLL